MSGPVIWIDPGHGGVNIGTHDQGFAEKNYTLMMAQWLLKRSSQHSRVPCDIQLSRSHDTSVSLQSRATSASLCGASLAVIVHVNAGPPSLSGADTYVWPGDDDVLTAAKVLQRCMPAPLHRARRQPRVASAPRGPSDSWLERPRAVLRHYRSHSIPAVLVELGYRTSRVDRDALMDPCVQLGIAAAFDCMVSGWISRHF